MPEKMWGDEPYFGLGYDWDPDWLLTDRQQALRDTLIELCERELRANAKRFDDTLEFPRRNLELLEGCDLCALGHTWSTRDRPLMKLLLVVKGLDEVVEVSEDLSGDVALQAADDLSFALAFERSAGHVGGVRGSDAMWTNTMRQSASLASRSPRGLRRFRLISPDDASIREAWRPVMGLRPADRTPEPASPRWSPRWGPGRSGAGRWKGPAGWVSSWPSGWWAPRRWSSMSRPSWPPGCGSTRLATAARPTATTPSPSLAPRSTPATCAP